MGVGKNDNETVLVARNLIENSGPGKLLGIVVITIAFVLVVGIVRRRIC